MIVETLAPFILICLLLISFCVHVTVVHDQYVRQRQSRYAVARSTGADQTTLEGEHDREAEVAHRKHITDIIRRYISVIFLITYLVLPGVTTTIAGAITTINVDPDGTLSGVDVYYLRNDFSIASTSSRYKFGVTWATAMFMVYPVGIPFIYYVVLRHNRDKIIKGGHADGHHHHHDHEQPENLPKSLMDYVTPDTIHFLYQSYEPQFWYWEIVETARRLLLTAVVSIVSPGTRFSLSLSLSYSFFLS
jgi:hypothetical protein